MQEEEAALLSLGAVLEWHKVTITPKLPRGSVSESASFSTEKMSQLYMICFNPEQAAQTYAEVSYFDGNSSIALPPPKGKHAAGRHWYNTVAEAKAACEIHAATGLFPSGVEATPLLPL